MTPDRFKLRREHIPGWDAVYRAGWFTMKRRIGEKAWELHQGSACHGKFPTLIDANREAYRIWVSQGRQQRQNGDPR